MKSRNLIFCILFLMTLAASAFGAQPPWIFGMHDPGGEQNAVDKGKRVWIVFTEEIGHDSANMSGRDYSQWANAGHGVIVRLNNGYGSAGTLPYQSQYQSFATRCANYVKASKGVELWIIGNETNLAREWPGNVDGDVNTGEPITVNRYVDCYNKCYAAIKAAAPTAQLCPSPSGTWAPPYPAQGIEGFKDYWVNILNGIGASKIDALALHAYTHGCDPSLVTSEAKMGPPYTDIYYNFRVYKNYMAAIPLSMRTKPVYITECDQNVECADAGNPPKYTWKNLNNGWVRAIYSEINSWNMVYTNQKIRCVTLFRWPSVAEGEWNFGIQTRQGVIDDWRQAMDNNYVWDTTQKINITKGPYIESCTSNSVTIVWNTDIASSSRVDYGLTTSYGLYEAGTLMTPTHRITLTGLNADTIYHYKVTSARYNYTTAVSGDLTFRTASTVIRPFANGGFETGTLSPWEAYGQIDGVITGSWFNGASPHEGTKMVGAAANYGSKNGGIYQRFSVNPGTYYYLTGWGYTWQQEGSATDNQIRFGIDEGGQVNPYSSGITWTPYWGISGKWAQSTFLFNTEGTVATLFADIKQIYTEYVTIWHVSCLDAFTLTEVPELTVQSAKAVPDNTMVRIRNRVVTAGNTNVANAFYAEEADRQSGIKVAYNTQTISSGDVVDVIGRLAVDAAGERYINSSLVTKVSSGATVPDPVGIRIKDLGGSNLNAYTRGITGGVGPNNVGLLVKTFGKVTAKSASTLTINDGGAAVQVNCPNTTMFAAGDYVAVTGVVGKKSESAVVIYTRSASDIKKY